MSSWHSWFGGRCILPYGRGRAQHNDQSEKGIGMPRLMSVALTTDQVRRRVKTQTRRVNWWMDKRGNRILYPGDLLTLCKKVRGRRHGEPLEVIETVETLDVRREPLEAITAADVIAEGFPDWTTGRFIDFYCATHRGVTTGQHITRIEWGYPRVCRVCGCTDYDACETICGPCAWRVSFADNTGICTGCPA